MQKLFVQIDWEYCAQLSAGNAVGHIQAAENDIVFAELQRLRAGQNSETDC